MMKAAYISNDGQSQMTVALTCVELDPDLQQWLEYEMNADLQKVADFLAQASQFFSSGNCDEACKQLTEAANLLELITVKSAPVLAAKPLVNYGSTRCDSLRQVSEPKRGSIPESETFMDLQDL